MRWSTTRCSRWTPSPSLPTDCRRSPSAASAGTFRSSTPTATSTSGEGPPSATVRDIERNGFRVRCATSSRRPSTRELIHECLDEVDALVAEREGGMCHRAGLPLHLLARRDDADALRHRAQLPAAGPGHQRRECRGVRSTSPTSSSGSAIATIDGVGVRLRRHGGGGGDLPHRARASASTYRRTCRIGCRPRPAISVSFSIPFFTAYCRARRDGDRINRRLRKLHLSPRPPGASEPVDRIKAAVRQIVGEAQRRSAQAARHRLTGGR